MKKSLVVFLVISLLTGSSSGQTTLGFRLGYNGNILTTSVSSIQSDFISGFHAGVFMRFGKRIYFAPELLYMNSGASLSSQGTTPESTWNERITIGSTDLPLLFGLNIFRAQILKWRLELGPVFSLTTNTSVKASDFAPIYGADITPVQHRLMAGTGIDMWFLTLDVRYQYTLNNIIAESSPISFDNKNSFVFV